MEDKVTKVGTWIATGLACLVEAGAVIWVGVGLKDMLEERRLSKIEKKAEEQREWEENEERTKDLEQQVIDLKQALDDNEKLLNRAIKRTAKAAE